MARDQTSVFVNPLFIALQFEPPFVDSNWSAINSRLTNTDVYSLAIDPKNTQTIYAGTYGGGVFKSTNGGSNWSKINSGLTNTTVWSLAIDPTNTQIIYAGTDGGVFRLEQ